MLEGANIDMSEYEEYCEMWAKPFLKTFSGSLAKPCDKGSTIVRSHNLSPIGLQTFRCSAEVKGVDGRLAAGFFT